MPTKQNPGERDCYARALPDEPYFVLLARDPSAPFLVRDWAETRNDQIEVRAKPESDRPMVQEAIALADAMTAWRVANDGKWREPPAPVDAALELIGRYGGNDGGHHKQWVLDQVARALLGDRYAQWRLEHGGQNWEEGIPP